MKKFLTQKAMRNIRKDIMIVNSKVKRKEMKQPNNITRCFCGSEGCVVIH